MPATVAQRQPLTDQQTSVFRYLVAHWGDNGVYPTVREICAAMGFSAPNSACVHLKALAKKGWIVWDRNAKARGVRVAELQDAARMATQQLLKEIKT